MRRALCLTSLLALLPTSAVAAPATKPTVGKPFDARKDLERRAIRAWHRIRKQRAAGVSVEEMKLPEAATELDAFITTLEQRIRDHAPLHPPTKAEDESLRPEGTFISTKVDRSEYLKGFRFAEQPAPLPPALVERFDNAQHPHFLRERAYLQAVLVRAKEIRAAGIPYGPYIQFFANHAVEALDLGNNPYNSIGGYPNREHRPDVDLHFADGKLRDVGGSDRMFLGEGLVFPTTLSLSIGKLNNVSGRHIYYQAFALDGGKQFGDARGASYAMSHDLHFHTGERFSKERNNGAARTPEQQKADDQRTALSMKITRAFVKLRHRVKEPAMQNKLNYAWFAKTHEDGLDVTPGTIVAVANEVLRTDYYAPYQKQLVALLKELHQAFPIR